MHSKFACFKEEENFIFFKAWQFVLNFEFSGMLWSSNAQRLVEIKFAWLINFNIQSKNISAELSLFWSVADLIRTTFEPLRVDVTGSKIKFPSYAFSFPLEVLVLANLVTWIDLSHYCMYSLSETFFFLSLFLYFLCKSWLRRELFIFVKTALFFLHLLLKKSCLEEARLTSECCKTFYIAVYCYCFERYSSLWMTYQFEQLFQLNVGLYFPYRNKICGWWK